MHTTTSSITPIVPSPTVQFTGVIAPIGEDGERNPSVASIQSASEQTELIGDASNQHHEGIYWPSPITMASFFLFGVLTSYMHHLYYHYLDGKQVGNDRQQQWALRQTLFSSQSSFRLHENYLSIAQGYWLNDTH